MMHDLYWNQKDKIIGEKIGKCVALTCTIFYFYFFLILGLGATGEFHFFLNSWFYASKLEKMKE